MTDLSSNERRVLTALADRDVATAEELGEATGMGRGPVEGAANLLRDRGLVEIAETRETDHYLTDEGETYAREGLPERRLHDYLEENDDVSMDELREVDGFEVGVGHLRRKGWAELGDTVEPLGAPEGTDERALEALAEGREFKEMDALEHLRERGLVERETHRQVEIRLNEAGRATAEDLDGDDDVVGEIDHDLLASDAWRDAEYAEYNVEADAEPRHGGRVHVLRQLADRVKEVLVSMGFEEMEGPHVDSEFYINDCLFMPQDHPARTHWDKFLTEEPTHVDGLPDDLVEAVEKVHREGAEGGEGYHSEWSRDVARRLNLRGHTTSLSVRYLSRNPEPPQRYFSVDKVYRNDTLDPTHLLEFYQIEGWVMDRGLSVRDLMGTFVEFYSRFGIEDIEFKPHYNPYTEPSFELFGRHPGTDELIEIGNSGMFRREVLEPHGVDDDVEVMAWGLALERLLMLIYGFEDIRDVHGTLCDLELLREVPVLWR
ncbi:MAG: phenylalanine--tRNA ligase subunit alpha [Halobacteriales archaeon]